MLTVMYDDDLPTAAELEQLATALASGGLGQHDADRAAHVLRAVAASLNAAHLAERVSDEGFD